MTRDELLALAREAGIFVHDRKQQARIGMDAMMGTDSTEELLKFAEVVASNERRKHQADIERWKAEAATAEKWRGLAMAREGANGRVIQEVQEEAAALAREACIQACDAMPLPAEFSREGSWAWECGVNACIDAIRAKAAK